MTAADAGEALSARTRSASPSDRMPRKPATSYEVVRMHDLSCVVHLHSTHSDGTGTVREIARAAARARADVVLLTDHDTLAAKRNGEEGWYGDVLLLAGEEVSPLRRDHYLAFGIDTEIRHRGLDACAIARAVRDAGGFGFAAHPFSEGSKRFKRPGHAVRRARLRRAPRDRAVEHGQRRGRAAREHPGGAALPRDAGARARPPARAQHARLGRAVPDAAGASRSAASTRTSTASGSGRSCRCG